MPWKLNHKGERGYHRHDPEKVAEMDIDTLMAFGVKLYSRYGQVREMAAMLKAVAELHSTDRDTLSQIKSIFWDSPHCNMTVEMREGTPWGWFYEDAKELAHLLQSHGCPGLIWVNVGKKSHEIENYGDEE